jgi:hypothetical protein
VRVIIAGNRHSGWIHLPEETIQHQVTEMAGYRRRAGTA